MLMLLVGWGQPRLNGAVPLPLVQLLRWLATPVLMMLQVQSLPHLPRVIAPLLQS